LFEFVKPGAFEVLVIAKMLFSYAIFIRYFISRCEENKEYGKLDLGAVPKGQKAHNLIFLDLDFTD
jgi:hypothetical protein